MYLNYRQRIPHEYNRSGTLHLHYIHVWVQCTTACTPAMYADHVSNSAWSAHMTFLLVLVNLFWVSKIRVPSFNWAMELYTLKNSSITYDCLNHMMRNWANQLVAQVQNPHMTFENMIFNFSWMRQTCLFCNVSHELLAITRVWEILDYILFWGYLFSFRVIPDEMGLFIVNEQ